jgi:hypothetical protein
MIATTSKAVDGISVAVVLGTLALMVGTAFLCIGCIIWKLIELCQMVRP